MQNLEATIASYSLTAVLSAAAGLLLVTVAAVRTHHFSKKAKTFTFSLMVALIIIPTLFLIVSTIYLNAVSVSKGPVHWHADLEIWACGKELNLKDPKGLSNKIGTATLHEHNDKRIHLEGVVVHPEDASLGNFFHVIGGELTSRMLVVPTEEQGLQSYISGNLCPNGEPAEVQVFVYTVIDNVYTQQKLVNPEKHIMAPYASVPTGDCVIIEFDAPKERTEKLCRSYKVAEEIGKVKGGQHAD